MRASFSRPVRSRAFCCLLARPSIVAPTRTPTPRLGQRSHGSGRAVANPRNGHRPLQQNAAAPRGALRRNIGSYLPRGFRRAAVVGLQQSKSFSRTTGTAVPTHARHAGPRGQPPAAIIFIVGASTPHAGPTKDEPLVRGFVGHLSEYSPAQSPPIPSSSPFASAPWPRHQPATSSRRR